MNNRSLVIIVIILAVILAALAIVYGSVSNDRQEAGSSDEAAVRELVESFGKKLQNVPLSGLTQTAAKAIVENYSAFVSASLVTEWANDPSKAPGRLASSPWPDRIEIEEVIKDGPDSFEVHGDVIEITSVEASSGGVAASYPVDIGLKRSGAGKWEIAIFEKGEYDSKPEAGWVPTSYEEIAIERPSYFSVETGESLGGGIIMPSILKVSFPRDHFKADNTNFSEAYLVISRSADGPAVQSCENFTDTPRRAPGETIGTKAVNGVVWRSLETTDAAAGNIYESRLYRVVRNGTCYEAALTLHTGNIHNYPKESGIKEFDKEKAFSVLERSFGTLRFAR